MSLAPDEDVVARVRAMAADASLVVVIAAGREPLALALARAAVAPLAVERAPARLNAVLPAADADPADVDAAITWLERAASTTGQLLAISAPACSAHTDPARR